MLVYASAIFCSAFLLFLVQPLIAKQILPWFGGSAVVWATCLVFFQVTLLIGYAYADRLTRWVSAKNQWKVHSALGLITLLFLPIIAAQSMKPDDATNPAGRILLLLLLTIGAPYFFLSTTGPLIQSWFSKQFPNASVYRLYALSNAGSMLALVIYPSIIEPNINIVQQAWYWSAFFVITLCLILVAAWLTKRSNSTAESVALPVLEPLVTVAPNWKDAVLWVTLSACASALLIAVTNHLTQNVASVPFLWILPLAIYLLTFILTFDSKKGYPRNLIISLACILAPLMLGGLLFQIDHSEGIQYGLLDFVYAVPLFSVGFFVLAMFCHGELVQNKPSPSYLTQYFLSISVGGAIGGGLVALVAPLSLATYMELPLLLYFLIVLVGLLSDFVWQRLLAGISFVVCLVFLIIYDAKSEEDAVAMGRNFYGTLRVETFKRTNEAGTSLRLRHGVILHGEQFQNQDLKLRPTSYYGEASGVGVAFQEWRKDGLKGGFVGLGVGTLAAYGRANDQFKFYELNPMVLEYAEKYFTFLSASKAKIGHVLGDARLSLERETPNEFDILVVDAFSSDSIPVHLLTSEAMAEYAKHLKKNGVIAIHISNRYLDLRAVTQSMASAYNYEAILITDEAKRDKHLYRTDWVLLSQDLEKLNRLVKGGIATRIVHDPKFEMWTDSKNNLLKILK
jgi:hypothetical protein